ncbi:hypothetical protein H4S06_005490 [Coemansia sp. BCRC 34490]|nr:hypothetical protein H4S06_005490 [Coemansia sp. BCRC 34490]
MKAYFAAVLVFSLAAVGVPAAPVADFGYNVEQPNNGYSALPPVGDYSAMQPPPYETPTGYSNVPVPISGYGGSGDNNEPSDLPYIGYNTDCDEQDSGSDGYDTDNNDESESCSDDDDSDTNGNEYDTDSAGYISGNDD